MTVLPQGNVKATREDWLAAAKDILVAEGVERVKILTLSDHLSVSRSSFYWYFKDRDELLKALIEDWQAGNTGIILAHAAMPSQTITEAVLNLFRSFISTNLFNHRLDFAIRDWGRRDPGVQAAVDAADERRLTAIEDMYARHGANAYQAEIKARILYYMQIGYYALELEEPTEARLSNVAAYTQGFTGETPREAELAAFKAYARSATGDTP